MNENATAIATLANSADYQQYQNAFAEAVGLPLGIRPLQSSQMPLHGQKKENAFCALMASKSRTCAACLQSQERLAQIAMNQPAVTVCARGLREGAAPIRLGNRTIGFLQTGQVMCEKPTEASFRRVCRQIQESGVEVKEAELRKPYFSTTVVPKPKFEAVLRLLGFFAEHLSAKSNEIALAQATSEPPLVTNAKKLIRERYADPLTLDGVSKAVHTSKFNFCKIFKRATGLTFTDFLARTRTEVAKKQLHNRNRRVSEIAYDVGFQSLTHFNRVFRALMGMSPTDYRERLGQA